MATLDETGLHILNYEEILEQLIANAKDEYGQDVMTDSNSVIGHELRTRAWLYANLYQFGEQLYFNQFIDSSTGINLDMLGTGNYSVTRLPATPALANVVFKGSPGTQIPAGTTVATEDSINYELIDEVILDVDGNGKGIVQSSEKKATSNVPANTITVMVDQINGVDGVTNPDTAEGGAEREDDADYQQRIHLANEAPGGPTKNGIISALYKVPGVQLVDTDQNEDWFHPNAQGDPPGSIHIYVQGGRNEAIGQMLFDTYAYGVPLAGDIEYTATDLGGHPQVVRFSKAKAINIYAKITLLTDETFDSSNDVANLQNDIANYVSSVPMGQAINYNKFIQIALNINGVEDCSIQIGTDRNSLSNSNIALAKFNSGVVSNPSEDVQVVINND